ncbi:hypothetical protein B0J13DRAFT_102805 [Dactylonectria estremocensis]|uniref:Uncharacterized protein n=1 Tax=Dactylonectria estremocensis TaxID=1079267 RepID=A0A9P9E5X0_9HYPO|nr:hypothetical protein B0J13DRAFT_102805 [Dactylonectria estremocensis]
MIEPTCFFSSSSAHAMTADRSRTKSVDDLQPWTAARCHRLLRQLQCRLGALRRLVHEARQPATRGIPKQANSHEERTKPPKRVRYTYAQRRSTSSNHKTANAALTTPPRTVRTLGTLKLGRCSPASEPVEFLTPVLRRVCSQPAVCSSSLEGDGTTCSTPSPLISELQSLRRLAPEGHYRIYEAVFGWLSGMLRSTESRTPAPLSKSLLGMCLRKVPAALADIEAWDRQVAEENGTKSVWDSSNASVELYEQLEGFGTSETGWKPLRLVVRAHALLILGEAVSEGLFEPEFVRLLAQVYLNFKCAQDAAAIVLNLPSPLAGPKSSLSTLDEARRLGPLAVIAKNLQDYGSGSSFDCLSSLIKSEKLPLAWVYTKGLKAVWATTLEAIATSRPEPSAIDFICTVMCQLSVHQGMGEVSKGTTAKQALASMAAGLTATAVILGKGTGVDMSSARRSAARRMMHVLDRCVCHLQRERKTSGGEGFFVLIMARYIAMAESEYVDLAVKRQAGEEFRQLVAGDDDAAVQAHYLQAVFLMSTIARYRGRVCSIACHDILLEICTMLNDMELPDWFSRGLTVDGAFLLAQKTNDLRDIAFADKLHLAGRECVETGTFYSGWRWEEGISEWVLPSPTTKARGAGESLRESQSSGQQGRQRGRDGVRVSEGGSRKRDGRGARKGGRNTNGDIASSGDGDGDGDGECDRESDKHGTCEDDSGDELSSAWDHASGICGLGLGNAARTSIVSSDVDLKEWLSRSRSIISRHRIGRSNEVMGEQSPTGRGRRGSHQGRSSSSAASAASSSGCKWQFQSLQLQSQSQSQSQSKSQTQTQTQTQTSSRALAGVGRQPTNINKRAGSRTIVPTQAGDGAGLIRGMSQRRGGVNWDAEDDWDELL